MAQNWIQLTKFEGGASDILVLTGIGWKNDQYSGIEWTNFQYSGIPWNIFTGIWQTFALYTGGFKTIEQLRRKHTKECNARKMIMK